MDWDQRNAMIYFQRLYEEKKIPGDAFIKNDEQVSKDEA
jgi:hypothetical protein